MVDILEVIDEERYDGQTTEEEPCRKETDGTDYDPCQQTATKFKDCLDLKCVVVCMCVSGGGLMKSNFPRQRWLFGFCTEVLGFITEL